ncbi:hypothetical protein [Fannyhessea vaginae]|uniref:hypothetical protein n=1 Tax=Fannyhessea vaginae TaxID=82135 RepID=UPI002889C44A|nr:hypothetical protein [Fannyhessea vaginae]
MATSEAQKRANANYKRRSTKTKQIVFFPDDMDLYEWVCMQPKQNAYLKDLIRKDMHTHNQYEQQ